MSLSQLWIPLLSHAQKQRECAQKALEEKPMSSSQSLPLTNNNIEPHQLSSMSDPCIPKPPAYTTKRSSKKHTIHLDNSSNKTLEFHHVTVSSATGKITNPKDSSIIRANAMIQVHRNRRLKISQQIISPLGAGRCDPFLDLPAPINVPKRYHELIDFCITTVWPGMHNTSYSYAYAKQWLPEAARNPAILHGMMYSSSTHLEALRGKEASSVASRRKNRLEHLEQKGEAIRAIREGLKDESHQDSDALIQSIIALAMCEIEEHEEISDWSPFAIKDPFTNLQWLAIYGSRTYSMPHVIAVQELVEKRGGIRKIKSLGLPWMITCAELISCAATLNKPHYPILDPFGKDIKYQPFDNPPPSPPSSTTSGFSYLRMPGLGSDIIGVFLNARDYSQAIETHEAGSPFKPLPSFMADNRNWILYRLLTLPDSSSIHKRRQNDLASETFCMKALLYETTRLASLIYGIHVIFPTPRSRNARDRLLILLKEAILKIDMEKLKKTGGVNLLLWCIVVGGIASAKQNDKRPWFLTQRNAVAMKLSVTEWEEVKGILRGFAWVDSACDQGGEAFWKEIIWWGDYDFVDFEMLGPSLGMGV